MIKILIKGEALDLPEGFSMAVEDTNPIFNDQGSQSIPATVPPTRRNNRLTATLSELTTPRIRTSRSGLVS